MFSPTNTVISDTPARIVSAYPSNLVYNPIKSKGNDFFSHGNGKVKEFKVRCFSLWLLHCGMTLRQRQGEMEDEFKIEGEAIEHSVLEEEIERRVRIRREAGIYSPEIEALLAERLPQEEKEFGSLPPLAELDYATTRASSSWEVTCAYPVSTEKKVLRPFIIFIKRLARLWARIAVGPIQREQTSFNRHAAQALSSIRRMAIAERQEALAKEEDLSLLSEALVNNVESDALAQIIMSKIKKEEKIILAGPSPKSFIHSLEENGFSVLKVSCSYDKDFPYIHTKQPITFLVQLPEESADSIIICELSFWLKPEALISLLRNSYLVLKKGGLISLVVHHFALKEPAPAWCSPDVLKHALTIAGFKEITEEKSDGGGMAVTGKK